VQGALLLPVNDANVLTVLRTLLLEFHEAVFLGEQRMVAANANITAGMDARTALTNNNISGNNTLAAKQLNAQAFAF
jgi:hypothetical protein